MIDGQPTPAEASRMVRQEVILDQLRPIEEIIDEARNGRMFILVDDEDRENEGDLVIPAQMATPDAINFMAKHGRGLICLTLTDERCRQLGLQQMVRDNRTPHGTAFTVSIEAATGVTTGISAADRARTVADAVGAGYDVAQVDAGNAQQLKELIVSSKADLVLNAVDPRFVPAIFDAALEAGVHYIDMATSLSVPDKQNPYTVPGEMLGDYQVAKNGLWEAKGKVALIGMGMDPGLSNIFAAYAKKWTFDDVSAVHIRDGGDLRIEGYPFATVFSLWTVIEECLNPPIVWRNGKVEVRAPFSEPEDFVFPEGVGPVMCVNVEHEEVVQLPRTMKADLITFKYALGADFIETLQLLHRLGLDGKEPINVKGTKVAPRDVIGSALVRISTSCRSVLESWEPFV